MSLRVTQQVVEALGAGEGILRVSRQDVEVLLASTVILVGASDSLSLTETAIVPVYYRDAEDSLNLEDAGSGWRSRSGLGADTLSPTEGGVALLAHLRAETDSLSLTEGADAQKVSSVTVAESLSLSDGALAVHPYRVEAEDTLSLSDAGARFAQSGVAEDSLVLSDEAGALGVWTRVASDTLELTDSAAQTQAFARTYADTLSLTDAAGFGGVWNRAAEDTLALDDEPDYEYWRTLSDSLSLTDVSTVELVHSVSDTIGVTEACGRQFVAHRYTNNGLHLRDSARPGLIKETATDSLALEIETVDPETGEEIYVGLRDAATVSHPVPGAASSHLSFGEHVNHVVISPEDTLCVGEDNLSLTDGAIVGQVPYDRRSRLVVDALTLTDAAGVVKAKAMASVLTLTNAASFNLTRAPRPGTDTLTLGDAAGFRLDSGVYLYQYHPFVGSGPAAMPAATCPTPTASGVCRLCYPVSHPTEFVELGSPSFGNRDRQEFTRINRETRGGTLVVYADPVWPKVQTRVLSFSGLTYTQVQAYLTFVETYPGMEVGFVDWEGFYWSGVILNPSEPTVQDDRSGYTIRFEFECETAVWEP